MFLRIALKLLVFELETLKSFIALNHTIELVPIGKWPLDPYQVLHVISSLSNVLSNSIWFFGYSMGKKITLSGRM